MKHQYIERHTGRILTEKLYGDRIVNLLYSAAKEDPQLLFRALSSARMSRILGFLNFEAAFGSKLFGTRRFLERSGVNGAEHLCEWKEMKTLRDHFERKIPYWESRPMQDRSNSVVSPADSRVLVGSFSRVSSLLLKEKFFSYEELLGTDKPHWLQAFEDGDFAIFRLTPDKYHYNHTPVAGTVEEIYEIPGGYHSCNPGAVVAAVTPYSKNKRIVTIIDTDVPGGTRIGLVAMIEVVALMIGDIVQRYSERRYDDPRPVAKGMFLKKGVPKSLYRPGSSTDVLLFQEGRIEFAEDIVNNMHNRQAVSRFSLGFGRPLVETDVSVRSLIAEGIRGRRDRKADLWPTRSL